MPPKNVVFIHGMFMTPLCWEHWVGFYESKGYTCLAAPWPGRDRTVQALRGQHPDPELGRLKLQDVVNHMAAIIAALPERPILIGHSMGGLVVQLLLQRDLASAGVAIDPAPPQWVLTAAWSYLKSNFPSINPLVPVTRPIQMPFQHFQYAFVNTLTLDEQRAAYDRYVVPESRGVPTQSLTSVARIDFRKRHAPLLIVAGEKDHIIPASLNKSNYSSYRRYRTDSSLTEFKVFEGRDHFIIGEAGWQEVADFTRSWLEEKAA